MIIGIDPKQVVYTNQARCRDCYRCVRVCPVKAIRIEGGQAFVYKGPTSVGADGRHEVRLADAGRTP